jgi:formate dehydrogenase major subunit
MAIRKSICTYCGCGCRLSFYIEKERIFKVMPDRTDPVSQGKPCIKGLTLNEVIAKDRILKPLIRKDKKSDFKEVGWDEAVKFIYNNTKDLAPEEIFFAPSGKITNEDNWVMQKFARVVFGTNSVDGCCTRLCHKATVQATLDCLGLEGIPNRMDDIYRTDCILIIGSNPLSNYPVMWNRILEAKSKGTKIISIQAIFNPIAEYADLFLTIQPGTELALINGLINLIIKQKGYVKAVEKIEQFEELKKVVEEYEPESVAKICGVEIEQIKDICKAISDSKRFGLIHGMGVTQHANGLENIHSLLNLLILKKGFLLSGRGEVNVQGVGDMWCIPDIRPLCPPCERIEKIWKTAIPKEVGKNIIEAFLLSPVKAAFISSFNPAQSLPDLNTVHKHMSDIFIVQMDHYQNLTSQFANVILPTPTLLERNGTITTGERRVRLCRQVIKPIGLSIPEWKIFQQLAGLFGKQKYFKYKNEKEIFKEIVKAIPDYSNLNPEKIYSGFDGWPNKKIKFYKFWPEHFKAIEEIRSKKYPFLLTTFRSQYQFLTGEMTGRSESLKKASNEGPFIYINPIDARFAGIKDGQHIEVISQAGSVKAVVKISERMPKGILGAHIHFEQLLINKLFPAQIDRQTFTPNYKTVAVAIRKI